MKVSILISNCVLMIGLAGCGVSGQTVHRDEAFNRIASQLDEGVYYRWVDGTLYKLDETAVPEPDDFMCTFGSLSGSHLEQRLCKVRQEWEADRDDAERFLREIRRQNAAGG